MCQEKENINPEEKVDFTYPEGFRRAAMSLYMLPNDDEARERALIGFVKVVIRQ